MKKRNLNMKLVSTFLVIVLLISISVTATAFKGLKRSREPLTPLPHVLVGYAFYDELGVPADGAQVMVRNLRSGDEVFSEVYSDGFYSFSVVSDPPESDWLDGDSVRVSFEGVGDFEFWVGSVVIVLDFDEVPQELPDVFLVEGVGCSFDLCAGWNLITIPMDMGWTAEDFCQYIDSCNSVLRYDPVYQDFLSYSPGVPQTNFDLEPGVGYFAHLIGASVLSFINIPVDTVAVQLHPGWNIIGWFQEYDTDAESLSLAIAGANSLLMFDKELQDFISWGPGVPGSGFQVTKGMGVFVHTTQSSIWHGEG